MVTVMHSRAGCETHIESAGATPSGLMLDATFSQGSFFLRNLELEDAGLGGF